VTTHDPRASSGQRTDRIGCRVAYKEKREKQRKGHKFNALSNSEKVRLVFFYSSPANAHSTDDIFPILGTGFLELDSPE